MNIIITSSYDLISFVIFYTIYMINWQKCINTLCLFIFILLFFIRFENSLDGIVNSGVTFVVIGVVNNEYVLANTHHGFDK